MRRGSARSALECRVNTKSFSLKNKGITLVPTRRLAPRSGSAVVNYDGCTVDYTDGGMDPGTGVFNVTRSGIYQLSFTAKYVAHNQV